tara:strand:+ start:637 stop:1062 length:426 start_codon:yes stop_codon:yes gene_type:complete
LTIINYKSQGNKEFSLVCKTSIIGNHLTFKTINTSKKLFYKIETYREGPLLKEAVDLCNDNGVEFYAVNENYPGETDECQSPRKLEADIFIDDRNIGGFLGWETVWQTLHPEGGEFHHQLRNSIAHFNYQSKRKSWYKFFS